MATIKKNTLVLDVAAIEEDFFEYANIYGLRFAEEPYYCAWFLNNNIGTNFIRNKYFFTNNKFQFDLYEWFDKKTSLEHLLFTNAHNGNFLIRELRGFHFFWIVKGEDNALIYMNSLQQKLKILHSNIDIQMIDIGKIPNKSVFLF